MLLGATLFTNPDLAFLAFLAGVLGIYGECCRPGWVLPGVCGGVLATLAFASLLRMPADTLHKLHGSTLLFAGVPFALVTVWLARVAIRARSNKRRA